ncbi:MAG: fumarate hydratase C-terminal domain-containing protein [Kiritimatiellae bacterium]|nr:fumarate hydratase C-terminal domain-containing protein [Kiritimatiellia bacterium]
MIDLKMPCGEREIRALKAGDAVRISGLVHTGRDRFHKWFAEGGVIDVDFRGGALYHCGPVVVGGDGGWRVVAAGPTTSVRENPYEPGFIRRSGVRVIIGKGGMDAATLEAMRECGAVYVQAVGGAAAVYAAAVRRVAGVSLLDEFGAAEACWHFEVEGFPGVVAMDSHGVSLFDDVGDGARRRLDELLGRIAGGAAK